MALTAQQIRQAYAQATKSSLLISLGQEALKRLIRDKPAVGIRLVERLSERVRTLEDRLEDVSFKEMPARLASLVLGLVESEGVKTEEGYYKIPTRYSHDQLATMINAHRVSVTRAFKKLREGGAVEIKDHLVHIKDIEALGSMGGEEQRANRLGLSLRRSFD